MKEVYQQPPPQLVVLGGRSVPSGIEHPSPQSYRTKYQCSISCDVLITDISQKDTPQPFFLGIPHPAMQQEEYHNDRYHYLPCRQGSPFSSGSHAGPYRFTASVHFPFFSAHRSKKRSDSPSGQTIDTRLPRHTVPNGQPSE